MSLSSFLLQASFRMTVLILMVLTLLLFSFLNLDDELKFLPASPAFPNAREISLSRNLRSSVADKTTLNNSAIISSPPAYGLSPSAYGASKRNSALSSNSDIFQMHATNRRIDSGINHHARLLWQTTLNGIIEMRVDSEGANFL